MKVKASQRKKGFLCLALMAMVMGLAVSTANAVSPPPPDGPPAPLLIGIAVSGPTVVNEESTAQYTCIGNYSDGTSAALAATWDVASASAAISASGLLSTGDISADQNATVTATYGGFTAAAEITIKYIEPELAGITITGLGMVSEETTAQYTCTASYSDGSSAVVAPSWSENSAYATISGSGLLSAGNVSADQSVTLSASFGGKTDVHVVTIKYIPLVLMDITISGRSSLDEETTAQYTCTASYSDGTSAVVAPSWSENASSATISGSGVLTAGDVGSDQSVTVSASYEGKSDTFAVTINHVLVLESLVIAGPDEIEENTTAQYVCTVRYTDGTSTEVNPVWSVDSANGSIDGSGLLTAGNIAADEQATLRASFEGQETTHALLIMAIGNQGVIPLSGFNGQTVLATLSNMVDQSVAVLGVQFEPEELVIEVESEGSDQWYWLELSELDEGAGTTNFLYGHWIWM